jgi:proteasome lid subunit RPN8/RPN11
MFKIKKEVMKLICEASKDSYPNEFAAFLRMKYDIVYEIILLPGTISGSRSATYKLHMKPIDFTIVGTVHSHPSGVTIPSEEDLNLFSKTGKLHLIVGYPFGLTNFSAYDRNGNRIEVKLI